LCQKQVDFGNILDLSGHHYVLEEFWKHHMTVYCVDICLQLFRIKTVLWMLRYVSSLCATVSSHRILSGKRCDVAKSGRSAALRPVRLEVTPERPHILLWLVLFVPPHCINKSPKRCKIEMSLSICNLLSRQVGVAGGESFDLTP